MEFLKYTKELNELVISLQEEKEIITDEDLIKAIFYLNNIYINEIGDCLIFLAALNLCNAYVKQNDRKLSYVFKKGIEYIIDVLNYNYIEGIYINRSKDNGTLYIFQVGNIQFSFHDEKMVIINDRYVKDLVWDGVRKQSCAKTIMNSAINNKICVSNITFRGKNIKKLLDRTLENYRLGKVTLDDLKRLKI